MASSSLTAAAAILLATGSVWLLLQEREAAAKEPPTMAACVEENAGSCISPSGIALPVLGKTPLSVSTGSTARPLRRQGEGP